MQSVDNVKDDWLLLQAEEDEEQHGGFEQSEENQAARERERIRPARRGLRAVDLDARRIRWRRFERNVADDAQVDDDVCQRTQHARCRDNAAVQSVRVEAPI